MFGLKNMVKPAQRMLLAKNMPMAVMRAQNVRCFSFGGIEKASQKLNKAL